MATTNRLATLELTSARPTVKPRKRPRRKRGRRRDVNKSSKFIELPMDLVFEISIQLHPMDLLRLSRVSKLVRSVYMSRQAQPIWRAALKRIEPTLSPCTPDLNEVQYASLIFEVFCMACGNEDAKKDFSLQLSLCSLCRKMNVVSGYILRNQYIALPSFIYSLCPIPVDPDLYKNPRLGNGRVGDSRHNRRNDYFYKAEFEMVAERYISLQDEEESLNAFIEERQQMSSDMMAHGYAVHSWHRSFKRHQKQLIVEQTRSITQKLEDAGWGMAQWRDLGEDDQKRWEKLLNIPEPLTDESLRSIYKKIELIFHQSMEQKLSEQLDDRAINRYTVFLRRLSPLDRGTMPRWPEARKLPSITNALSKYSEDIDRTQTFWDSLFSTVSVEAKQYSISVRKALVGLLKKASPHRFPSSATPDDILNHAFSVFQCTCGQCCHRPVRHFSYPDILVHNFFDIRDSWRRDWVKCDPGIVKIGFLMLKTLNLPADTSKSTIEELDGKLICLCGHPDHRRPTSFYELVNHVADENDWFDSLKERATTFASSSSIALFNDHNMEGVDPVVTKVSPNMKSTSVQAISRRRLEKFFCENDRVDGYCSPCYRFSGQFINFKTEERMLYHMRAKHHIKILKKTDFGETENLTA